MYSHPVLCAIKQQYSIDCVTEIINLQFPEIMIDVHWVILRGCVFIAGPTSSPLRHSHTVHGLLHAMIVFEEKAFEVALLRGLPRFVHLMQEAEEQLLLCIMSGNEATLKVICHSYMVVAVTEIRSR